MNPVQVGRTGFCCRVKNETPADLTAVARVKYFFSIHNFCDADYSVKTPPLPYLLECLQNLLTREPGGISSAFACANRSALST